MCMVLYCTSFTWILKTGLNLGVLYSRVRLRQLCSKLNVADEGPRAETFCTQLLINLLRIAHKLFTYISDTLPSFVSQLPLPNHSTTLFSFYHP